MTPRPSLLQPADSSQEQLAFEFLHESLLEGKSPLKGLRPLYYVPISDGDIATLLRQDPATRNRGGFQGLLVKLQTQINLRTRMLRLDEADRERCCRYATQYGQGGWQTRLFRTIVSKLP